MNDDQHVIDKGWDALPEYTDKTGEGDDAVTVSISTAPGEWLVNTSESVVVPMSMAEVVDGLRAGKLTERSLVWRQGMQEWSHIGAVPQLKLAARLPSLRATQTDKPVAAAPAQHTPVPHMLSRRSTLPFGMPTPPGSRPAHTKPSLPAPPAPASEEPEVLAVYDRPAATISFDLSPEQPLRGPPPPAPPPIKAMRSVPVSAPQTLAPLTSDSAPRSAPRFQTHDLSVVAAADFRAVQRSSKRMVLLWSLGSAAAASLLTFLIARSEPTAPPVNAAAPATANAPAPPAAKPEVDVAPPPAPPTAELAPTASAPAVEPPPVKAAPRKVPKPQARRSKPVLAAPTPAPTLDASSSDSSSADASEPNPYDVKLEEETPKPPPSQGSGLEDASGNEGDSAAGSKTPGF